MKPRFNLTRLMALVVAGSLLLVVSCSKEHSQSGTQNEEEERASMVSSEADSEAELIFNGIFDDAMGASDDVGMAGTGVFGRNAPTNNSDRITGMERVEACYTVTVTHLTANLFPVRVVIDFGNAGCLGNDGHIRSGKIVTEYSSRLILPGAVATCSFEDFYLDSIKVEGKLTISNKSTANNRQFLVEVSDAKLKRSNGNFTEWNSSKTITQTEGLITPNLPLDDIFQIEGSASGRVQRGNLLVAWEAAVTEPLIKRFNCRWIVRGIVNQSRINTGSGSPWAAILDFGNGDCNNQAIVTINGVGHNITLH